MIISETVWLCDNGCGTSMAPDEASELESEDGRWGMVVCEECVSDPDFSEWRLI